MQHGIIFNKPRCTCFNLDLENAELCMERNVCVLVRVSVCVCARVCMRTMQQSACLRLWLLLKAVAVSLHPTHDSERPAGRGSWSRCERMHVVRPGTVLHRFRYVGLEVQARRELTPGAQGRLHAPRAARDSSRTRQVARHRARGVCEATNTHDLYTHTNNTHKQTKTCSM